MKLLEKTLVRKKREEKSTRASYGTYASQLRDAVAWQNVAFSRCQMRDAVAWHFVASVWCFSHRVGDSNCFAWLGWYDSCVVWGDLYLAAWFSWWSEVWLKLDRVRFAIQVHKWQVLDTLSLLCHRLGLIVARVRVVIGFARPRRVYKELHFSPSSSIILPFYFGLWFLPSLYQNFFHSTP